VGRARRTLADWTASAVEWMELTNARKHNMVKKSKNLRSSDPSRDVVRNIDFQKLEILSKLNRGKTTEKNSENVCQINI